MAVTLVVAVLMGVLVALVGVAAIIFGLRIAGITRDNFVIEGSFLIVAGLFFVMFGIIIVSSASERLTLL